MSATVAFSTRWRPLLLGAVLAVSAAATPLVWAHAARAGHGPMGAPMAGGMGPVLAGPLADDPARLDRWLDRMAQHLQLQPAQRDDIRRIAQAAAQDLRPLRDEARALHDERRRLWAQPTLDEAAIEALRQRALALHERLSARMQQAMLEAARVLTPEQRQRLAQGMDRRGAHRHGGQWAPRGGENG
ncbi:MAG: Spy/CpxP family protein refolding chaperone [Tepidimonas fonticaldi]|nr:Spy/CpxP family protein refolding chaperone [Tepidimonas fonticaldi]